MDGLTVEKHIEKPGRGGSEPSSMTSGATLRVQARAFPACRWIDVDDLTAAAFLRSAFLIETSHCGESGGNHHTCLGNLLSSLLLSPPFLLLAQLPSCKDSTSSLTTSLQSKAKLPTYTRQHALPIHHCSRPRRIGRPCIALPAPAGDVRLWLARSQRHGCQHLGRRPYRERIRHDRTRVCHQRPRIGSLRCDRCCHYHR